MLNVDQAVALLGYTKSYFYKLTAKRKLPFYKPLGGKLYFSKAELIDFMKRNKALAVYEQVEQAGQILNRARR
jgi:excisionase family DNA binding protein